MDTKGNLMRQDNKDMVGVTISNHENNHLFRGVAQFGRVLRSGRRGRWLQPSHPESKIY